MDRVQMPHSCRAITGRQFSFNHELPKSPWYSLEQPWVDERLSQPWSHLLIGEFLVNKNIYPETYTKNLEAEIEKQRYKKIWHSLCYCTLEDLNQGTLKMENIIATITLQNGVD